MKTFYKILFSFLLLSQLSSAQWVQSGLDSVTLVNCFAVKGSSLFAGTGVYVVGHVFRSSDNGTSWAHADSGLGPPCSDFEVIDTNLFAGTWGGVFLSTNNGTSWTAAGLSSIIVGSLAASGTNLFAGSYYDGVFLSTNNGTSWTAIGLDSNVCTLLISGSNLFAGTGGEFGRVFLSTNNGASWIAAGSFSSAVMSLAVSGTNLFAATIGSGVFLSTNNGTNWTEVSTGLSTWYIRSLVVSGTNLFAGSYRDGVFLSTNNGTNWTEVNTGLSTLYVWSLGISDPYIFAGTSQSGVWRRPLSEMITDIQSEQLVPIHFALEQNYPNPFNPNTKIMWQSPIGSWQTIKVFDVLGNEIATLIDEYKPAGKYEVEFNAASLPSGVYFYQLKVGEFTITKKMILLR